MKTLQEKTTPADLQAYTEYFSEIAKESVRIFIRGNNLSVFGSEIGCLRIAYQHRNENIEIVDAGPMAGWCFISKNHHEPRLIYAVQNLETILDSALNLNSEVISVPDKLNLQRTLQSCHNIIEDLPTFPF